MGTVSKEIADKVIAGYYPEDNVVRIIKYTNAWGGEAYGLESERELGRYKESEFVINPEVYWTHPEFQSLKPREEG
jgi:hypothetical protein